MGKLQSRMKSGYTCYKVLQFLMAQGCSYNVINVLLVGLRNELCIGGQNALFLVSYEEAYVVRAHSTTHGYPTNLPVILFCEGECI